MWWGLLAEITHAGDEGLKGLALVLGTFPKSIARRRARARVE